MCADIDIVLAVLELGIIENQLQPLVRRLDVYRASWYKQRRHVHYALDEHDVVIYVARIIQNI